MTARHLSADDPHHAAWFDAQEHSERLHETHRWAVEDQTAEDAQSAESRLVATGVAVTLACILAMLIFI